MQGAGLRVQVVGVNVREMVHLRVGGVDGGALDGSTEQPVGLAHEVLI